METCFIIDTSSAQQFSGLRLTISLDLGNHQSICFFWMTQTRRRRFQLRFANGFHLFAAALDFYFGRRTILRKSQWRVGKGPSFCLHLSFLISVKLTLGNSCPASIKLLSYGIEVGVRRTDLGCGLTCLLQPRINR